MSYLSINQKHFPDLTGKIAVISGGCSGIGFATARILLAQNATVYLVDLRPPKEPGWDKQPNLHFLRCDVSSWVAVRTAIIDLPHVDLCFANAGIVSTDEKVFNEDHFDEMGQLTQPTFDTINVNIIGLLNLIKVCRYKMRQRRHGGSIVMTASSVAYSPEKSFPIYSATKGFMLNILRGYRSSWIKEGISLNAVAPNPTITAVLPPENEKAFRETGTPLSEAHDVGLALVFSAVAKEDSRVEFDLRDDTKEGRPGGRWNGRMIWVVGKHFSEVEEPYVTLREQWLGEEAEEYLRRQQLALVPWWP